MVKKEMPQPTNKELAILQVLWEIGSATVRMVNGEINKVKKTGYTTTLKLMQIMTEKGSLICDKSQFKHVYAPAITEEKAQNGMVGDLLEKAFSGSAAKLVMRALSAKKVSTKELAKIKKMVDSWEEK
ncbi:MAG: BlaI/MecI/CopY family transcriptional regulator [Planctomycetes bacterium]|nr:BlaI/MecI/CopY family transcriptional regulator [Planctomycetota bacterium]